MSEWIIPGPIHWNRFHPPDEVSPRLAGMIQNARCQDHHRIGLLGLPFDGAIPTRPGARFGPETIRQGLTRLSADDGRSDLTHLDVGDYGDVRCLSGNTVATHDRVYQAARTLCQAVELPVFLGGDHSLTFPCFRAVAERHHPLGLITFDAHHDVRTSTADEISSGTPFRRCLELGASSLKGGNLVQIGLRPFANSRAYADYCREQGVTCYTIEDVEKQGMERVARSAVDLAGRGTDGIYLSIDIDVVDAAFAPGASATAPGGLTAREILQGVAVIGTLAGLVGCDLMEVSPPLDEGGRTGHLAASLLATLLAASCPKAT